MSFLTVEDEYSVAAQLGLEQAQDGVGGGVEVGIHMEEAHLCMATRELSSEVKGT